MTENYYKQDTESSINYDLNETHNLNNQNELIQECSDSLKEEKNRNNDVFNLLQNQSILKKKKYLKLIFKTYSIEDTEKIIACLQDILKNKIEEKRELSIKAHQKEVQILKLLETIKNKNIDIDTLKSVLKDKGIDNTLNNFKYQYKDESGIVHYWSGKGRVPLQISIAIQNGKSKEDFLRVNQDDNLSQLSNEDK